MCRFWRLLRGVVVFWLFSVFVVCDVDWIVGNGYDVISVSLFLLWVLRCYVCCVRLWRMVCGLCRC